MLTKESTTEAQRGKTMKTSCQTDIEASLENSKERLRMCWKMGDEVEKKIGEEKRGR